MKRTTLITIVGVFFITLASCQNNNAAQKVKAENVEMATTRDAKSIALPVMAFTETEYDFGTINEGDKVEHEFTFTNTGKAPLVIINAKGSCGCTVPEWSKEPIAPGASGTLLVAFNSNGKPNLQNKQITITANTEKGKEILKIKAMVTPKAKVNR
ncbi:DUF1573 domain-containing protein [Aquimarina sp. MMG016]|uniref:DUF1573 domain-containing protein n=1 Tax=Aquimarina sp. MMG016 TaxID=2822690 RepID=UPI001B3A5B48|nr:DUF1573 domain-containing protein [Aquimarina sp. MMG016]MBQ4822912.1 DUF1573 domain-containing protein [Aquimarina sp. MMG016]